MKTVTTIITAILIPFFCGMLAVRAAAQEKKYIMLSMLDSLSASDNLYKIDDYTLNTKELYGVDETIKIYNVHYMGLVLFSVLPDFTKDKNWSEVDLVEIQGQVFDEQTFRRTVENRVLSQNSGDKKTLQYRLVKSENGKYVASNHCLTEFFFTDTYLSLFNNPYGTINIGQDILSIRQMEKMYRKALNIPEHWFFPLDVRLENTLLPNRLRLQREYLSRKFKIKEEDAYQFWTLTDWSTADGYDLHRGVDRFIYMPGKGIVGGSYDFWFLYFDTWNNPPIERKRNNKTKEELWHNVLEEKVMLAEELK